MDNNFYTEVYGIKKGDVLKNIFLPLGKLSTPDIIVNGIFSLPSEFNVVGGDGTSPICGDYSPVRVEIAKDGFSTYNYDFLIRYYDGNKLPSSLVDCGKNIEVCFEFVNDSESKMLFTRYERIITRKGVLLSFKGITPSKEIRDRLIIANIEKDTISSVKLCMICEGHKIADYI